MGLGLGSRLSADSLLKGLERSFAVIEFTPSGEILRANDSFCSAIGYGQAEIIGRHHSLFVDGEVALSPDYKAFWRTLSSGQFVSGEFKRKRKDGSLLWIRASYTPVIDQRGKVVKEAQIDGVLCVEYHSKANAQDEDIWNMVKLALDITPETVRAAENASFIQAIHRSQAVIKFSLDGVILDANDNFLAAVGYSRDEIIGRHHSLFVKPDYAQSSEYAAFWSRLGRGEFFSDEFERVGKGGRPVWLQAQYNPLFDADGKIVSVIKIATDLTERMRQVRLVGDALESLSHGDLRCEVRETLMPSLDSLRISFNESIQALNAAMSTVAASAASVGENSDEISSHADGLAHRTEQQAASLEETAAALEEITATVARTASGAKHADAVVQRASKDAEASRAVVESAVEAMGGIEKSSSQIGQIVGVIDELAFQTNILALNAAVEAARAGEAGRGFAVVAQEVRALAQRSAEAAREIKVLIAASSQHVNKGVALVGDTGEALNSILSQVEEIRTLVGDISHSAQEQAAGLNQVSTAVSQMDRLLQTNAGMVEEATASAHVLKEQANRLQSLIDNFQLARRASVSLAA